MDNNRTERPALNGNPFIIEAIGFTETLSLGSSWKFYCLLDKLSIEITESFPTISRNERIFLEYLGNRKTKSKYFKEKKTFKVMEKEEGISLK